MPTESKVTEISYMTDNFCKEFISCRGKQMIKIVKCNKPNPAKNLNLNGQKQARKVLKLVKKKHTVVFKKTSRGIFENVQCFFKNVQCFFQNNGMF